MDSVIYNITDLTESDLAIIGEGISMLPYWKAKSLLDKLSANTHAKEIANAVEPSE
jgi:hypothetical protein